MTVIHPTIFDIIQRFPNQRETILGCHNNSHTFRAICEDLKRCKQAYKHWSQLESPEAQLREVEYRELLENLWAEIDRYLKANCTDQ